LRDAAAAPRNFRRKFSSENLFQGIFEEVKLEHIFNIFN